MEKFRGAHHTNEVQIIEIDGVAIDEVLIGDDVAEAPADLNFPASSLEDVRLHPQFPAFAADFPDAELLPDGRLEAEFVDWQSK